MDKIRLLHIAQSAGYGVTMYVESLIKSLDSNMYEQYLLGSEYYNSDRFSSIVNKLITIKMDRNISFSDYFTILKCRKIIKEFTPDIVYCHSAKAGIYGRLACVGTKTKVVYNPHGWSFNMRCSLLKRILYKYIEAIFAIITDKIVCISDYEFNSTPWCIPSSKLVVIKNGINVEQCYASLTVEKITRGALDIPENAFVVGIIARISIQKGQDMLVDIATILKQKIPNVFFLIVGGKSDDIPIEKMIDDKGVSNNFFITGEVDNAIEYASLFDVAVLTSRWEGFGLVLLEYMLANKPIVAFEVDAIPEIIINRYNGLLVPSNDLTAFADAIYSLYNDDKLKQELMMNGKLRVNALFNIKRVADEHEKNFAKLCLYK
ncbi:MAG: glycosyltransferase family 4 protein [Bacteroides xylanisolvens]